MRVQEAKGFIQGKLDCMNKCDVFECKGTDECENCNYCYSQGNFGEQKEAFKFAIECMEELEQYRALGTVEELKEAREKQISIGLVLDLAWRYGQIDGAHHKMWVIDQMVRALCGSEEEYKKWVSKYTDDDYDWDCGIAP